jgi:hypothetical protein
MKNPVLKKITISLITSVSRTHILNFTHKTQYKRQLDLLNLQSKIFVYINAGVNVIFDCIGQNDHFF